MPQPGLAPGGQRHASAAKAVQPSQYCTGSGPMRPESIHPVCQGGRIEAPKAAHTTAMPSSAAAQAPSHPAGRPAGLGCRGVTMVAA